MGFDAKESFKCDDRRGPFQLQIDRALVCRLDQRWPLHPMSEFVRFELPFRQKRGGWKGERGLFTIQGGFQRLRDSLDLNQEDILTIMKKRFPCVQTIMDMYPGKVFPCGAFFSMPSTSTDLDLFFVNCSPMEAKELMDNFEKVFSKASRLDNNPESECKEIESNGDTTIFKVEGRNGKTRRIYRFIHNRIIYSSLSHVLGDLELAASMIAYDGKKIVATEQGAWARVNKCVVIDISRWSSSSQSFMSQQVSKYHEGGFSIVFPGIYHEVAVESSQIVHMERKVSFLDLVCVASLHNPILIWSIEVKSSRDEPSPECNDPGGLHHRLVLKATDFYGRKWNGRHAILSPQVYHLMHWMRKQVDCVWSMVPKDIINLIIKWLPYI